MNKESFEMNPALENFIAGFAIGVISIILIIL